MAVNMTMKRGFIIGLLLLLVAMTVLYFTSNKRKVPELVTNFIQSKPASQETSGSQQDPSPASSDPILAAPSQLATGLMFRPYKDVVITDDLTPSQAETAFYNYIEVRHLDCTDALHVGDQADSWPVCVVSPYRPRSPCLVYSFGVNNDYYQLEKGIVDTFSCTVRVFDPRLTTNQEPLNEHISAYTIALSNSNSARDTLVRRTMATLLNEYNEAKTVIDYLKLDIDSNEWGVLEGMIEDKSLSHVKQLAITIHTAELAGQTTSVHEFKNYWHLIHSVENLGFRKWYASAITDGRYFSKRTDITRTCCYQLVFVNTNFADSQYRMPDLIIPTAPTDAPTKINTLAVFEPPASHIEGITITAPNPVTLNADMSPVEAEEAFYRFLTTNSAECTQHQRLGNRGDGGWDMCTVGPYQPKDDCMVYSFGINNEWSFDDAISRTFGCTVKAFDPSMHIGDHKHSTLVWFYHTGIGGNNEVNNKGWKLRTLGTLFKELGDTDHVIDYLKIDVEYSEWDSFVAMFVENALTNVKQFGFEIHTHELYGGSPTTVPQFVSYYNSLRRLEDIGFRKWLNHNNPLGPYTSSRTGKHRTCCYELYYINTRFMPQV